MSEPLKTIDYIYRFDPSNPSAKPLPADPEMARARLEDGNRMFAQWMESCRTLNFSSSEARYVVPCNAHEVGMVRTVNELPKQSPFAVVIGCSDARVPTEMIFGQGFNDLFVIRVAGNVLGDECLGSVDFALNMLSESVRVVVVLGHQGCGGVTSAVDAYLQPLKFWSKTTSHMLRSIMHRLFVPIQEAAKGLEEVWGDDAARLPGYREALIESAVFLNAAQAAYDLYLEVERAGKWEIEVLFGVYNLQNHRVSMPVDFGEGLINRDVNLAYAPTNPRVFRALAVRMAERLLGSREGGSSIVVADSETAQKVPNGNGFTSEPGGGAKRSAGRRAGKGS